MAGLAVQPGVGNPLPDADRWANAASALAAIHFGAQTSAPNRDEVEQLLDGVDVDNYREGII